MRCTGSFFHNASQQPKYYQAAAAYPNYPLSVINSRTAELFVAEEEGLILGFLHVAEEETPPFEAFVQMKFASVIDLFVLPAHRSKGIGSALLAAARQWAKERGLSYMELNVLTENENAIRLYQKQGYGKVSHILRCPL